MRTLDYTLPASQGGGKLVNFRYSRSLSELIGSWSAEVAGGSFTAGDAFSVPCMRNGIVASVYKDPDGMIHLTGKDAGVRLMRTTPPVSTLAEGGAGAVIQDLAAYCGIGCSVGSGLSGFNARSVVTGTTCAEAILELAMLSGCVAYISNAGGLVVSSPASGAPNFPIVLDDSGSELDLDGYATRVSVILTRRKRTIAEENQGSTTTYYKGKTPSGDTKSKTQNGTFNYTDAGGQNVHGSYSVTTLEPLGVLSRSERTITRNGVTVKTTENHVYDVKSKTVWRGDQEFRLFAYCEKGYQLTQETTGSYPSTAMGGGSANFSEKTVETMSRTFSIFDAQWVPEDWKGALGMVEKEQSQRVTTRTGGLAPEPGMPPYAPPFDVIMTREFKRTDFGHGLICSETETRNEARQVGTISSISKNDELVRYNSTHLAIPSHSTPQWVGVETYRTYYDKFRSDGTCEASIKTEWCDDGARWMLANGLLKMGDEKMDRYQEDYAKFTQATQGMEISLNGGGISSSLWQFLELPGRVKVTKSAQGGENDFALDPFGWYWNGGYVPSRFCPHYDRSSRSCGVFGISAVGNFEGEKCPYSGRGWSSCVRAKAALEQARSEKDRPLLESPVVGLASIGSDHVGYQREIYVDEILTDGQARSIANAAAQNILRVKGTKGLRRTVTIPYNEGVVPNGSIVSVSHDWGSMQTTVGYRVSGSIPNFLIPASVAGVASGISDRDAGRRTKPMSGTVVVVEGDGTVLVNVGESVVPCSTKLINIGEGDAVLVSFTSGNAIRGQIVERM